MANLDGYAQSSKLYHMFLCVLSSKSTSKRFVLISAEDVIRLGIHNQLDSQFFFFLGLVGCF